MSNKKHSSKKIDKKAHPILAMIPNMVTLASICVGLSAIRYAIHGEYHMATAFVLLSGFMDGIDGRLARFFNSSSDFGAQLDSLADFVNFGVVPGFVIYCWVNVFADMENIAWSLALFFAICDAIRLARFNVDLTKEVTNPVIEKYFFKGIPAPCGAAMSMLPMVLFYEFGEGFYSRPLVVITYVAIVAILMASRVPTISIKKIKIGKIFALILILILFGLLTKIWLTLSIVGTIYGLSIPVTIFYFLKLQYLSKNA